MSDLFDKCVNFTDARRVIEMGLYPYFTTIESAQETEVIIAGKKVIMLGSNSYMGLTYHPEVREAAKKAIDEYGVGCAGSRFLNGTLKIHEELEEKLAHFVKKESALLYSTGFQTNLGVISTLVGKDDYMIIDRMNHASIIDACRLSFGTIKKFKHNNMDDLERVLKGIPNNAGKLIIVDGVFSMEGDIAKLPQIIELCKKYNARVMVDDAHSVGVLGENGRGTAEYHHVENETDIIMNTFSKTFASIGGYLATSEEVIHYLKHNSRTLIFSASLPPASVAAVSKVLDIIQREPERRKRLWDITEKMRKGFKELGFDTGNSETPIIPIRIGEMLDTFTMRKRLLEEKVFVNPVVPPAVSPGDCLIRTSFMATHTDKQLDFCLDKFEKVGKELKVI